MRPNDTCDTSCCTVWLCVCIIFFVLLFSARMNPAEVESHGHALPCAVVVCMEKEAQPFPCLNCVLVGLVLYRKMLSAVWLLLAAVIALLITGVSDAFVAPSASLSPSASASRGAANTRPSSRSSTSSGCCTMSADGGGAAPGKDTRRCSFVILPKVEKSLPQQGATLLCWSRPACAKRTVWFLRVG